MLLALPLPWAAMRLLPAAPPSTGGVLYAPFARGMSDARTDAVPKTENGAFRLWSALLCWLLLVLAAARPQWLGDPMERPETGRNLLLAVDVSGSMETPDLEAGLNSRLDVVKQVASEFIQRREGDRVGLILFGSQAYLQTPLTFDRVTVTTLLNEAAIGIAGRDTAIGDAIGMAIKHLRNTEGEAVLVLLTDGSNTAGSVLPGKAAELAAQQGLRIHTVGVGGKTRAVRSLFGTRLVNPAPDLDEETLKAIADATGGRYFRAVDRETLEEIYRNLDNLEPVTGSSRMVRLVDELYPWPLGFAFLLSLGLVAGAGRGEIGS